MQYLKRLESSKTHIDRLIGTGVVSHEMAMEQGATGPVERASNISHDLRRDHPYAAYDDLSYTVPVEKEGDAHARSRVRMKEVEESFTLIEQALKKMPSGSLLAKCSPKANSEGLGWVETPRGGLFYGVHIDSKGLLHRVKIKSPSFSNWRIFPFTVHGTGIMDFAINEASFGLTISGCDR
jgi:formate hydrogenlyase subunit 5